MYRLAPGAGARCIEAKAIFAGTPTEYLESVRQGVMVFKVVGALFAGFGALALGLGLFWPRASA